jgi:hypothetical protein
MRSIVVHLFALRQGSFAASFPQSFDKLSLQFHGYAVQSFIDTNASRL